MRTFLRCLFIFNFDLNQYPLCHEGYCCHYIETSQPIYRANQWEGFYTMAILHWNKLILASTFSIYLFLLSWGNFSPLSPSIQPNQTFFNKSITPEMQTENLPNKSHKQFHVILNTNQIKLHTYPELLKENNMNLKDFTNLNAFWTLPTKFFSWKISQLRINSLLFRWWDLLPHTETTFLKNDLRCNSH